MSRPEGGPRFLALLNHRFGCQFRPLGQTEIGKGGGAHTRSQLILDLRGRDRLSHLSSDKSNGRGNNVGANDKTGAAQR